MTHCAYSAAVAQGTTTTGTGECRRILEARDPQKTLAVGPARLDLTASTSPSIQ